MKAVHACQSPILSFTLIQSYHVEIMFFSENVKKSSSPPTYSRARELSESDESFYPPNVNDLILEDNETWYLTFLNWYYFGHTKEQ